MFSEHSLQDIEHSIVSRLSGKLNFHTHIKLEQYDLVSNDNQYAEEVMLSFKIENNKECDICLHYYKGKIDGIVIIAPFFNFETFKKPSFKALKTAINNWNDYFSTLWTKEMVCDFFKCLIESATFDNSFGFE
jgi:hypothetical protein